MSIIAMYKTNFNVVQLNNVTNINYNPTTKLYTITYNTSLTQTFDGNLWYISVLVFQ